jgi:hypothetical protein
MANLVDNGIEWVFETRDCRKQSVWGHAYASASKGLFFGLCRDVSDTADISFLVSESRHQERAGAGPMYVYASKAVHVGWGFSLILIMVHSIASLGHKRAEVQGSHIAVFDDVERDQSDDSGCEELIDCEAIGRGRGIRWLSLTIAL